MKIGLIRIDRMGDMVLTLPVIKSIKLINSSIEVDVFTSNQNHKILKNFKYVNKIISNSEIEIFSSSIDKRFSLIKNILKRLVQKEL